MKLKIYKGFETSFLEKLDETPLIEGNVASKVDVLSFDKKTRKKLERELLDLEEPDVVWITYQEYSLIKGRVDEAVAEDGLEVVIYRNNLLVSKVSRNSELFHFIRTLILIKKSWKYLKAKLLEKLSDKLKMHTTTQRARHSGISLSQHQQALESRSCSRFRRFILLKNIIN